MKHIVIDARIINSSTGRYVERLVMYLQAIDSENQYTILVPTKDLGFFKPVAKNFAVMACDFKNYSLAEQTEFPGFLNKLHADLVHFCMPQQPVLYKGRHVTTFHDLILLHTYNSDKNWLVFHTKQLVGRFVFKRVAYTSQHLITPTEFVKKELVELTKVPPNKVTVTYESADIFKDEVKPYKHPFKEYLLYVGQQSDYKNIRRFADAHQKLLNKHPDLGLILVGKKTTAHLKNEQYFKQKGFKNILFTGFIEDAQRDWLYKNCAVYVFPSLMEGFGLPGLEAMGYGAPVASSNTTCLPEVYGDAALYFDPLNTSEISKTIEKLLTNKKLRAAQIKKGYAQLKRYSWQRMAQQTHRIYIEALKN